MIYSFLLTRKELHIMLMVHITPYTIDDEIDTLITNLQLVSHTLLILFDFNVLKFNADKCKLIVTNHEEDVSITLGDEIIIGNKFVKLLGVNIDNKLDFNEHN